MKHQKIFNLIHEKNIYEGFDPCGLETFCSEFGKTYDTSNESWPQWIINN